MTVGLNTKRRQGRVDILAVDNEGRLVVIEIKAGKAKDGALGQILGYVGCLSRSQENIRGILVASEFDDRVVFASKNLPNIKLISYRLNFSFDKIT
jgi:endonuclease